jgi:hypothetical protein
MAFNGSGTYSLPAGNPVVTGTTISSTTHNNTMTDVATALSTCVTKDGQTTVTANIPFATFRLTGVGDATALQDAITAKQIQNSSVTTLSSVAGTNTVTASASPTPSAYASGQEFSFIPAVTNTGATTINVSSLGAKNIFANGVALIGGELVAGVPVKIKYDGTQFNILGRVPGVLSGASTASTSGTSIDYTISSWVKKFTVSLAGVSLSGTAGLRFQLGDGGGVETTGYVGNNTVLISGSNPAVASSTSGFDILINDASYVVSGQIVFALVDAATFLWSATGVFIGQTGATTQYLTAGHKALSAALDRVRVTTTNGTDTFDAGTVNILVE